MDREGPVKEPPISKKNITIKNSRFDNKAYYFVILSFCVVVVESLVHVV